MKTKTVNIIIAFFNAAKDVILKLRKIKNIPRPIPQIVEWAVIFIAAIVTITLAFVVNGNGG